VEDSSDARLVEDSLAGNKESFSALVRSYQDYAYGVAVGLLADFDAARDVVQESFLFAYRDLRKLKDPSRFGGWLRGIVRHRAFRALRELDRFNSFVAELTEYDLGAQRPATPDEIAEETERKEVVRRALERLNEKNREAVALYYVGGLSYDDISAFLGVSKATVQGRLQRARAKLREEIDVVQRTFGEEPLSDDFSVEIERLLESATAGGEKHELAIRRLAEIGTPAVDPLCSALGDPRVPIRLAAVSALCNIGDPRAVRPVLQLLYAGDWSHRKPAQAGRVLAMPGIREELIRVARAETGDEMSTPARAIAVQTLSYAADDPEAYEAVLRAFRDRRAAAVIRRGALDALCTLRAESAVDLILEGLQDRDLGRKSCWWVWWIAWSNETILPVETCLSGFGHGVAPAGRMFAGWLLLRHGSRGQEVLERALREGSRDERATAALALAEAGINEAFDVLMSELEVGHRDRKWVRLVQRTVARRYGGKIAGWAEKARPDQMASPGVAWLLARSRIGDGQATEEDLLRHATPSVRAATLRRYSEQKGRSALPELRRCLREGRPGKVAQEAFRQMLRLEDTALAEEMLASTEWTERKAAASLLRRWGRLTPEQKEQAEHDEHVAVRHAARRNPGLPRVAR